MKKLFVLSMLSLMAFSVACNRDMEPSRDTQDIQREESYEQDDINSDTTPSNIDNDVPVSEE